MLKNFETTLLLCSVFDDSQNISIYFSFGNSLIGRLFIPRNFTSDMYLDMIQNAIDPAFTVIIENNRTYTDEELIFQQYGASLDYS